MISIRKTLPLLLITPIVFAVGLTGWLAFRSGRQSVDMLIVDLNQQISNSIASEIKTQINLPNVLNKSTLSAVKGNNLSPEDFMQLKSYLWQQILWDESVLAFYYANEAGELLDVGRLDDGDYRLKIRQQESGLQLRTYRLDNQGNQLGELPTRDYNPRDRPWYQTAKTVGEMTWSPIYLFAPPETVLGITATAPVYDPQERLRGVFGVDISLDRLSQFLNHLDISPQGTAFIMEPSGELVATSSEESLLLDDISTTDRQDHRDRRLAIHSSNPGIQAAAAEIVETWNDSPIEDQQTFEFSVNDHQYMAAVNPAQGDLGLDWLIVVVIPKSDFMGYIDANRQHTIGLGLAILGLTSLLGWAIAIWLMRPILRLSAVAQAIETGQFQPDSLQDVTHRRDEVGQLATTFQTMAQTIYGREQGLKAKLSELRRENDQVNQALQASQSGNNNEFEQILTRAQQYRQHQLTQPHHPSQHP